MMIVIANDLPPAVRGRMKLWFLEPRPNIFVSGLKESTSRAVTEYLMSFCNLESGLIIFRSISKTPGYEIRCQGSPLKALTQLSGMQLVIEKNGVNKS